MYFISWIVGIVKSKDKGVIGIVLVCKSDLIGWYSWIIGVNNKIIGKVIYCCGWRDVFWSKCDCVFII